MNKGVIEMHECTYFLPLTLPFLQFRPPSGLTSSIIHSLQILELNYPNSSPRFWGGNPHPNTTTVHSPHCVQRDFYNTQESCHDRSSSLLKALQWLWIIILIWCPGLQLSSWHSHPSQKRPGLDKNDIIALYQIYFLLMYVSNLPLCYSCFPHPCILL